MVRLDCPRGGLSTGSVVLLLSTGLLSCAEAPEVRHENRAPTVDILTRPSESGRLPYRIEFQWRATDPDGTIDVYQYAIDPPEGLTPEKIDDPQGKFITWVGTSETAGLFTFRADEPEVLEQPDGSILITGLSLGEHSLFVRAIDNEGAASEAAYVSFTAENVLPQTRLAPTCSGDVILEAGDELPLEWSAEDPDGPSSGVVHEWKRIPAGNLSGIDGAAAVTLIEESTLPWNRVEPGRNSAIVPLESGGSYLVVVRARDAAGGAESLFILGQNVMRVAFSASHEDRPVFTASDRLLGKHTFPNDGPEVTIQTAAGVPLKFEMTELAAADCSPIRSYDWGLDVPDPEGDAGFHGYSSISTTDPLIFHETGIHVLTLRARNSRGFVRTGTIVLDVIAVTGEKEVLYVDDFRQRRAGPISDAAMDAGMEAMLHAAGFTQVDRIDVWGDDDFGTDMREVRLSDIAPYRLVVWSAWGGGDDYSALTPATECSPGRALRGYLVAGGALWLQGQNIFGALIKHPLACRPILEYIRSEPHLFQPGDFASEFLKIGAGAARSVPPEARNSALVAALGAGGVVPDLEPDPAAYPLDFVPGLVNWDVLLEPGTQVEPLYTGKTYRGTVFQGQLCGFRYRDPSLVPEHGPVAVFGFPLEFMKPGSAGAGTGTHGLAVLLRDWFETHTPAGSAARLAPGP